MFVCFFCRSSDVFDNQALENNNPRTGYISSTLFDRFLFLNRLRCMIRSHLGNQDTVGSTRIHEIFYFNHRTISLFSNCNQQTHKLSPKTNTKNQQQQQYSTVILVTRGQICIAHVDTFNSNNNNR